MFDSGSANLRPDALEILSILGQELQRFPQMRILVEGHTDNVPMRGVGPIATNWELSSMRATAVLRHLVYEWGIPPHRIEAIGRGEYHPIEPNDTPEGRQANRRVEIRLMLDQ
jgi:chemotaxis protein MotB